MAYIFDRFNYLDLTLLTPDRLAKEILQDVGFNSELTEDYFKELFRFHEPKETLRALGKTMNGAIYSENLDFLITHSHTLEPYLDRSNHLDLIQQITVAIYLHSRGEFFKLPEIYQGTEVYDYLLEQDDLIDEEVYVQLNELPQTRRGYEEFLDSELNSEIEYVVDEFNAEEDSLLRARLAILREYADKTRNKFIDKFDYGLAYENFVKDCLVPSVAEYKNEYELEGKLKPSFLEFRGLNQYNLDCSNWTVSKDYLIKKKALKIAFNLEKGYYENDDNLFSDKVESAYRYHDRFQEDVYDYERIRDDLYSQKSHRFFNKLYKLKEFLADCNIRDLHKHYMKFFNNPDVCFAKLYREKPESNYFPCPEQMELAV